MAEVLKIRKPALWGALLFVAASAACPPAHAEQRAIDAARSTMKVYVQKTGLFSVFAHNHEILAPIAEGTVEAAGALSVQLRVAAAAMRVLDPGTAEKERSEIQTTMLGPDVLDVEQYADIRFRSASVEAMGEGRWTVRGNLELHGQSRPLEFSVALRDGVYRGTAKLKQTDFGIQPVSLIGGTVKVKDEVTIQFEIALSP